jgi:opacity protein-like surface antigen
MKARISAMMCLLCVLGSADLTRAGDPSSQRVADPYATSPDPPTMSSGTLEPYLSFMAGIAIPRSHDATFTDGTTPTIIPDVDYQTKHSFGGNAGIWFPTRHKLLGFDLGMEITGMLWYADVACCRDFYNNDPTGQFQTSDLDGDGNPDNRANNGTTTEINGIYVGANFLLRYPMAISEAYPNGRWHPYVGIGVGAHQMAMKPGGRRGTGFNNAITEERDTTIGFMGVGGIKAHLFKYVAVFAEAKYIHAHHSGLTTDRYGNSQATFSQAAFTTATNFVNPYESTIDTILAHAGMSIHFDIKP